MFVRNKYFMEKPKLVAHRANCGDEPIPENTLAAVRIAHQRGQKWVECDVQLTADDVVIVIHDHTLMRTTDATGADADKLISEMTYAEISKYDAGIKYAEKFKGEKIPKLIDFLSMIKESEMGLLLEIKPVPGYEIETVRKTINILHQLNMTDYSKLLIQSFSMECLQETAKLDPRLNTGLILERWEDSEGKKSVEETLRALDCTALVGHYGILTAQHIASVKKETNASLVLAWTVNDKQTAIDLYQDGVDAMISDHPERIPYIKKLLRGSAPHAILFKPNEDDSALSLEKSNQNGPSMQ